jgi:hypothetical protein
MKTRTPTSWAFLCFLALLLNWTAPALAATTHDETVDGDLSGDPAAPTPVEMLVGTNVVSGSMAAPDDTRDFLTFTLPEGQQLEALRLLSYEDLDIGGPGNRGFHAINAGATSFIPDASTADSFLGGAHLDALPTGTDLLPILAAADQAGTGFTPPLGAGTYSYVIQQTGPELTGYSVEFVISEEGAAPTLDQLYFYPAAARSEGAEGSFFLTAAEIHNAGMETATYQLLWLPADTDNSSPAASAMFTLSPGASVRYDDVLGSVFAVPDGTNAVGGVAVLADSAHLLLFSRTANQGDEGSYGQSLRGFSQSDLIPENTRRRILFMTQNSDFRSNLGFINGVGMPVTVRWERFTADGTSIGTGSLELAAWSWTQINRVFADVEPVVAAYIVVWTETPGGLFMAYGSVLDNITSDPTTILPQ